MEVVEIKFGTNWMRLEFDPMRGAASGRIASNLKVKDTAEDLEYNAAIDGLEALVLAHACAGVDVTGKKYIQGLETALEAILNNLA